MNADVASGIYRARDQDWPFHGPVWDRLESTMALMVAAKDRFIAARFELARRTTRH